MKFKFNNQSRTFYQTDFLHATRPHQRCHICIEKIRQLFAQLLDVTDQMSKKCQIQIQSKHVLFACCRKHVVDELLVKELIA